MRCRRQALVQRLRQTDDGFSLIEVSVIAIVLGILSALAIPVFLHQQQKAQSASISSDLRSAANAMESYFASEQSYGSASDLIAEGDAPNLSRGTTIVVAQRAGGGSFCLAGLRNADVPGSTADLETSALRWYDSAGGGLLGADATGCPVTTGYASGWQTDVFTGPPAG